MVQLRVRVMFRVKLRVRCWPFRPSSPPHIVERSCFHKGYFNIHWLEQPYHYVKTCLHLFWLLEISGLAILRAKMKFWGRKAGPFTWWNCNPYIGSAIWCHSVVDHTFRLERLQTWPLWPSRISPDTKQSRALLWILQMVTGTLSSDRGQSNFIWLSLS